MDRITRGAYVGRLSKDSQKPSQPLTEHAHVPTSDAIPSPLIRIHSECGSRLGGVSLEFTGELTEDGYSVTECLGGSMGLSEDQLPLRYQVRHLLCMIGAHRAECDDLSRSATLA